MLKSLLESYTKDIIRYSLSLSKTNILIEKPWTLIDEDNEIQKLIFKKNNELILSKNGQVIIGKWDYFPDAKSLLIDRGSDKILCNETYIDDAVMILKLDGTNNKYFSLANENLIPDLDVLKYLNDIRKTKLSIVEYCLVDGRKLEIISNQYAYNLIQLETKVSISGVDENIEDGIYKLKDVQLQILVNDSKIEKVFYEKKYKINNDIELIIAQSRSYEVSESDSVYYYGTETPISMVNTF